MNQERSFLNDALAIFFEMDYIIFYKDNDMYTVRHLYNTRR